MPKQIIVRLVAIGNIPLQVANRESIGSVFDNCLKNTQIFLAVAQAGLGRFDGPIFLYFLGNIGP